MSSVSLATIGKAAKYLPALNALKDLDMATLSAESLIEIAKSVSIDLHPSTAGLIAELLSASGVQSGTLESMVREGGLLLALESGTVPAALRPFVLAYRQLAPVPREDFSVEHARVLLRAFNADDKDGLRASVLADIVSSQNFGGTVGEMLLQGKIWQIMMSHDSSGNREDQILTCPHCREAFFLNAAV